MTVHDAGPLTTEEAADSLRASTKTTLTLAPCPSATNVDRVRHLLRNYLADQVSADMADYETRVAAS
jgi:hypothetical protein